MIYQIDILTILLSGLDFPVHKKMMEEPFMLASLDSRFNFTQLG